MGKRDRNNYNDYDDYYDYKNSSGGYVVRKAFVVFLLTLAVIFCIGIPILLIANNRQNGPIENPIDYSFAGKWEKIPEADKIEEPVITLDENDKAEIVIPDEDVDYTQVISTLDDSCVTIGFAGDILFDDNYAVGNAFKNHGNSAVGVVGDSLLNRMKTVDIMMVNNEFPYSSGGIPTEGKTYTFRARPETANILNDMGVDIVGLANNHASDYGNQALLDTFDILDSTGIKYVGAGHNIDEASHTVYYVTESGMKIAIICATQIERITTPDTKEATADSAGVFRCLDDSLLLQRIREAKEKNAYVIVFVHWGTESTTEIDYLQRDQAAEFVSAGANLIIGGHPHVLQKIDYVGNVPVVYSLGNYIFNSKTLDTCMVIATLHNDGAVNLQFIPAIQSDCRVNEAFGSEAQRIIGDMNAMSSNATIDANGYISHK